MIELAIIITIMVATKEEFFEFGWKGVSGKCTSIKDA